MSSRTISALVIFALLVFLVYWLFRWIVTYDIEDSAVNIYVGPFRVRSIPVSRIASARVIKCREMFSFRVAFLRTRFRNRLGPAVDIALRGGGGVVITPDDPEGFVAEIEAAQSADAS